MTKKFKSKAEITNLAVKLKERRIVLGLTLKDIEKSQGINCGQLSRFEAGEFKTNSKNLQKLCNFLQITKQPSVPQKSDLGTRLEHFASLSPKHWAAAEELLNALERLS
jgi:transcriptional regulator with XRE-family HTH domain